MGHSKAADQPTLGQTGMSRQEHQPALEGNSPKFLGPLRV